MDKINEYLKKMNEKNKKREYNKSRVNVGIFPNQVEKIKKLLGKKYKSINHFVIQAVEEKLKETNQKGVELK